MATVIYTLRADTQKIRQIQEATLNTEKFGIQPTNGLFGSEEWWSQIAEGKLPVHTARGIIAKVYMGSMNDWPEFKMKLDDGSELTWTREAQTKELAALYREGRSVEVDYVVQKHKAASHSGPLETHCVIEIRVRNDA